MDHNTMTVDEILEDIAFWEEEIRILRRAINQTPDEWTASLEHDLADAYERWSLACHWRNVAYGQAA